MRLKTILMTCVFASNCHAAQIHYSETQEGDLDQSFPLAKSFILNTGINTIAGITSVFQSTQDWDNFTIIIPDGLKVKSISLKITEDYGDDHLGAGWIIYKVYPATNNYYWLEFRGSLAWLPQPTYYQSTPIYSGVYTFWESYFSSNGITKYEFQFDVASITQNNTVPEPNTFALACLALTSLFRSKRPRSTKSIKTKNPCGGQIKTTTRPKFQPNALGAVALS